MLFVVSCCLFFSLVFFFFFKQKTAYEMRISDWSSDVCSSDLGAFRARKLALQDSRCVDGVTLERRTLILPEALPAGYHRLHLPDKIGRASCRERGVSTCRSRWSPSN